VAGVTSSSALVSWSRPLRPNGVLAGYRLYTQLDNSTTVRTVRSRDSTVSLRLEGLRPGSTYRVWVKAFTPAHEGLASPPAELATEPARPGPPRALTLTCLGRGGLHAAWRGEAEVYMVRVGEERVTVAGQESVVANLSETTEHEVRVRGGVASTLRPGSVRWGAWSPPARARLGPACEAQPGPDLAVVAGVVGTLLLLGTVAVSLLVYRRCCTESYYYLEEASVGSSPSPGSLAEPEEGAPPGQFLLQLELLHREERAGLRAELAGVLAALQPADRPTDWVEGWGRQLLVPRDRPPPAGLWALVHREGLALLVETEADCAAYWPEVGARQQQGELEVACLALHRLGSHCLRRLRVAGREVALLQLLGPAAPLPLLSLARAARGAQGREGRPLLLGRAAGLLAALDTALGQLRERGTVGAAAALRRAARAGRVLVAREEELSLLLTTLGEAVCAGETWVRRAYLPRYVAGLVAGEGEALARQWALVAGRAGGEDPEPAALGPGATWLPGLHSPREFLLAGPPRPAATPQFWRLLWDCGVHTVLLLGAAPPAGCSAAEEGVTVTRWEDELSSQGRAQHYVLEDGQGGRRVVKLLQQEGCLAAGAPPEAALALADSLHCRQDQLPRAPLLLVAATPEPAAAFCALSTLLRQLELEQAADTYTVARAIETLLPGAFPSPASLLRLYRALEARLAAPAAPYTFLQPVPGTEKMI
jgi:hypothetical protein